MKTMQNVQLPPAFVDFATDHFRLLQAENPAKKRDCLSLRLSGYSDVMHLIADIVKVSVLALEASESENSRLVSEPLSNIEGVLSLILDLLPYEEAELLDAIRQMALSPGEPVQDWDFELECISLLPPSNLCDKQ